jgi:hypothetical protein
MVLGDKHIAYLRSIQDRTPLSADATVVAQMKYLGATKIATVGKGVEVVLTEMGKMILIEEDEAWG